MGRLFVIRDRKLGNGQTFNRSVSLALVHAIFLCIFSARLMASGKKLVQTAINIQCWLKFGTELPCQHIGINNKLDVSYRSLLPLSIFNSSPFHLVPNQIMFPCILCVFMAIHPFLIVMNSCCIKRQVEKKNCVKLIVVPKAEMWLIK